MSYDLGLVFHVEKLRDNTQVKGLFGTDNTDEILVDYFTFLKNGFVYSYTGIIENYFRSIAKTLLDKEDHSTVFFKIRESIFLKLGINQDTAVWKALSVLSNVRNSIHYSICKQF